MERLVEPELLDELPARDPRALRSRRDLRRVNAWMGHPRLLARALREGANGRNPCRIVELGAGDGHFLLSVARRLKKHWPNADATLVDRLEAFDPHIREHFNSLGWRVSVATAEAAEWLRQATRRTESTIISNLFLHQFNTEPLAELCRLAARSARMVIALEPRRSCVARFGGSLLWLIGCGSVTRHDGRISLRAGFSGRELSALWPDKENWELVERPAGLFSHLFIARRKD
jgi:hypothetical protein